MQAGGLAPGAHSRGDPRPGGKFAQLGAQLSLGAREDTSTKSRFTTWCRLADEAPREVVVASQSPGPETECAGKGCLRGAEHGEQEGR